MVIVCVLLAGGILAGAAVPANAATCYGEGCIGLNPSGTSCEQDAKTIGAMTVGGDGMLELRWSPSCNASWGRFSTYWRSNTVGGHEGYGISHVRVTAWNPGQPSQGVVGNVYGIFGEGSWWTGMVTGTTWSCTGVELYAQDRSPGGMYSDTYSLGWTWGPCVA